MAAMPVEAGTARCTFEAGTLEVAARVLKSCLNHLGTTTGLGRLKRSSALVGRYTVMNHLESVVFRGTYQKWPTSNPSTPAYNAVGPSWIKSSPRRTNGYTGVSCEQPQPTPRRDLDEAKDADPSRGILPRPEIYQHGEEGLEEDYESEEREHVDGLESVSGNATHVEHQRHSYQLPGVGCRVAKTGISVDCHTHCPFSSAVEVW